MRAHTVHGRSALILAVFAVVVAASTVVAQQRGKATAPNIVVALKGVDVGEMRPIPPTEQGSTMANCFDVPLLDPATMRQVGSGTDCLSDVSPFGDGLVLTGTTIFRLNGGTITTRGRTSVHPMSPESSPSTEMTHMTGFYNPAGTSQVIDATGRFAGLEGTVILRGAVNMDRFPTNNELKFDCIFLIDPVNR